MKGNCFCGNVRVTTAEPPLAVRACWCRDCQYLAAGSATVNAIFKAAAITIVGDLARFESRADSGSGMTRSFCARCGTPVSSQSDTRPHLVVLRAGLFDDRDALKPGLTIWTDSAPGWACLDASVPSTPRQPPPAG